MRITALAAMAAIGLVVSACGSSSGPLDDSNSQSTGGQSSDTASSDSDAASSGQDSPDTPSGTTTGGDDASGGPIVIGSANFTESELLADVYAAALKNAGVEVSTKLDIGSREVYLQAMADGSITVFPEYTGGLLAYYDSDSSATAADDVYADLQDALPDNLDVLEMSPAQDQDTVTVTKETAEKYDLESIGDLADVAGEMTLGGSSEWKTRADGPEGLKKLYGVEFKDYKELDSGGPLTVKGLKTGLVQATDIFSTNPAIVENDFVVLKDPKALFQAQNVVPLIASDVATDTVTDTLNAVSAALTTAALTDMQKTVNDEKADPSDIAATWVSENIDEHAR